MDILNSLITDFSVDNLKQFFRQKINTFKPKVEEYDFLFDDNEYVLKNYEDIKKIGEADLNNSNDLLVISAKTLAPLTNRTGKKQQFEIAKKILKEENKDSAIFVFYDNESNFRFSLIRVNFFGAKRNFTDFKRYTYFVSNELTNKTFISQISKADFNDLDSIQEAFSVEPLNKEFYKQIADAFYNLIGGKIKIGNKTQDYEAVLQLPSLGIESNRKTYQEFAVRLIGRIVFIWFLKNKTSKNGLPLIPKEWLTSKKVKNSENFYHNYLEKLFFEILNKPIEKRIADLPDEHKIVPFLNGGLFEPCSEDFYISGNNNNSQINYALKIPDTWILKMFKILEQFNFTIDENSLNDLEISIDPEMLGTIFENLLAEIDPDTEKSARKSTGSFYTPREIVDYMVEESLVAYLKTKTNIDEDKLHNLFKENDLPKDYFENSEQIINAFDKIKILDPACGSGAFPMGALHKINMALQKLDPDAEIWKEKQLAKIENVTYRNILKNKLDKANVEYIRKIGIVQNSIYGIDIQPIATEISKLRSFLSLVVDENINDDEYNRDILPLPNLEFKFVTANTLIGLKQDEKQTTMDFGGTDDDLEKLQTIRKNYLNASQDKQKIKTEFLNLQKTITNKEFSNNGTINQKAQQIIGWNPFSHEKADWFDPKWMFGVDKFDVVMGNPPYVSAVTMKRNNNVKNYFKEKYPLAKGSYDLYLLFILYSIQVTNETGVYSFIIPNKFLISEYSKDTMRNLINRNGLKYALNVSRFKVFKGIGIYPIIIFGCKSEKNVFEEYELEKYENLEKRIFIKPKKLKKYRTFKDFRIKINSGLTGFQAQEAKLSISEDKISNSIPFIVSGSVDRYLWENKNVRYMGNLYSKAYINNQAKFFSKSKWRFWKMPKIVIAGMTKKIESVYIEESVGIGVGIYGIYDFTGFLPYALTAILNSNYLTYYFKEKFKHKHLAGGYLAINKSTIEQIPLVKIEIKTQKIISNLSRKIHLLKQTGEDTTAEEREIDLMVYKLYELTYEEVKIIEPEFEMSKEEYENK